MTGRFAAVDVGTNTVLLTVASQGDEGMTSVLDRATITRLGQGVDRSGRLADDAMERTLECLRSYGKLIAAHGVSASRAVCTSAVRDAENGPDFLAQATAALGIPLQIVSGRREAELTFRGALTGLGDLRGAVTVFDVGGGSTEIIHGATQDGGAPIIHAPTSLDIGSVRLFERYLHSDPPSVEELAAAEAEIERSLESVPHPPPGSTLVGVAGTVTTLAAIHLGLVDYDAGAVHGRRLSAEVVRELRAQLAAEPLEQRKRRPGLQPQRADVIVSGASIVAALLAWADADTLVVSDRGVRFGLLWELSETEHARPR